MDRRVVLLTFAVVLASALVVIAVVRAPAGDVRWSSDLGAIAGPGGPADAYHQAAGQCFGCHRVAPVRAIEDEPSRCGLMLPGSESSRSHECLACHTQPAHGGHPYDIAYPLAGSGTGPRALRPFADVARRGLNLPDGRIHCVTCHERTSPWKYNIKLPPGSTPTHAVDRQRPVTYENPQRLPPPRPGDDVGKKALCLVCHAFD